MKVNVISIPKPPAAKATHRMSKDSHQPPHESPSQNRAFHKDWRTWTVVGLMLVAMIAYIVSMDEEFNPDDNENQQTLPIEAM